MSHMSHITNPSFLVYPLYVPPAKKKPEPKTARGGDWIESNAITEVNHERDSDDGESDGHDSGSDASGGKRGFDFTRLHAARNTSVSSSSESPADGVPTSRAASGASSGLKIAVQIPSAGQPPISSPVDRPRRGDPCNRASSSRETGRQLKLGLSVSSIGSTTDRRAAGQR